MSGAAPPVLEQWADMTQRANRAGEAVEDPDLPEDWREALRQASSFLTREVERLLRDGPTRACDPEADSGNAMPLQHRLRDAARPRPSTDQ